MLSNRLLVISLSLMLLNAGCQFGSRGVSTKELMSTRQALEYKVAASPADWTVQVDGPVLHVSSSGKGKGGQLRLVPAAGDHWDFSGYSYYRLEVHNTSDRLLWLEGRIDNKEAEDWANSSASQTMLLPDEVGTLGIAFPRSAELDDSPEIFKGMNGKPNGWRFHWKAFDPASVLQLQLKVHGPDSNIEFDILGMNLGQPYGSQANASLQELPYLDEFGQVRKLSWPGKVQSEGQLKKRHQAEVKALKTAANRTAFDQYGGWAEGPQLEATGFFRIKKYKDKWWFIDPEGRLFWSHGVNSVGFHANTPATQERLGLFEWLPQKDTLIYDAAMGPKKAKPTVNFWAANLARKHGPDWEETALDLIHRRYRAWGLNTIGAWSQQRLWDGKRTPYTAIVTTGWTNPVELTQNPYGGVLAENLTKTLQAYLNKYGQDPWCVGFFVDNEVHWSDDLVSEVFAQKTSHPAKQAFIGLLKEKYKDIAALNAAWTGEFADWTALSETKEIVREKADPNDFDMLYTDYAQTYYRTCRDVMRQVMPNHVYLGSRVHACPPIAARAAAEFVDVYSNNHYENRAGVGRMPGDIDKPVLITEFHFGAMDRGVPGASLRPIHDQTQRARAYANYIVAGLAHPKIVGAHWFAWGDQSSVGRPGENYQIGFVDVTNTPYPEFTQGCVGTADVMYRVRAEESVDVLGVLEEIFQKAAD
ncbi:MAG: beta-galactosidase [Planctomycetota bacterium]